MKSIIGSVGDLPRSARLRVSDANVDLAHRSGPGKRPLHRPFSWELYEYVQDCPSRLTVHAAHCIAQHDPGCNLPGHPSMPESLRRIVITWNLITEEPEDVTGHIQLNRQPKCAVSNKSQCHDYAWSECQLNRVDIFHYKDP
ncbi:hypothetical protein AVEN_144614-1 [Araneus ventricosus]|uniref:Uncharacterized protein n=1 Tax=Araneus ventricosus TaxID=182803 RepID=A0A4Y2C0Q1_ARAVE|nr:hypothetical protein AVEN_144614-1 [Araneus ventricosus]